MLTIYDSNGNRRTDIEAGDSSTQVKEVQGDNVLTLSFTHYEYIALDVNDRVDFEGERYWLTERYIPKQKSGQEWVYDLKFYGIESLVRRFLVLETTDGNTEPVFTLTATPREHVAMIVKCINDGMNHTTDWKVGRVDGTDLIVIDYEGKYCNEALKEIAEAVGGQAEWWVEGQTVNVCRCEHGEEITLGYGKGLTGIERDTTGTDNFYTRLFPVGSTRNIDPSKYGHSRLMLPGGRQYVEIHTEEYGIYDRYEQDAFSGIYPRRIGAVSSVRSEDVKDDDGNPFTVYYFRDDSLNFDPNDYELPDETKRVSFQDGDLSGLGQGEDHYFEVNFNSATREFEIITIWPYDDDTQLPGGKLIPKSGDRYILWNIRMPDEYYPLAEEEFLTAVEQFNTECWQDLAVYKAPTDHVWIEENGVSLSVGRRVRLESEEYFPETGYRSSRITKITRKVNQPGEMDIEISDALHSGAFERVNDSIGELKNYTKSKAEGAALPDIIRSWDKTLPTDNNLFSARRSQAEHISKKKNDRAKGKITFEAGASFGQEDNAGIDDKGNAELLTLVVREFLRSPKFVDGLFGEGWRLWMEDALSHLTIDKLTVRQVMVVLELLIEKVRSVGGQLCVSAANGKIKTAVLEDGYWRITFEQDNSFQAHDLMRCATFSGGNLKGYWVEVAGVEGDSILVSEDEFSGSLPEAGDECVLMGNTENPLRQNLILISATEDGQPRVDVMDGVKAKSFTGCLRARLGNLDGISDDWFPADNQPHGNGLYSDNAYLRGTFLLVTGEDIKTKFEIVEGRITSAVTALRNDFATEKGYLNNPAFDDGLEKWNTENETVFFLAGNKWIWANNNVLTRKGDGASVTVDDGRTVVHIRNKYILQKRANLKSIPSMPVNGDGEKEAVPVYLSFFYRCATKGTLRVQFLDVDKTGFANFMLEETGLVVKPEGAGIYAQDADGKLALIGVSVDGTDADGNKISVVKLTGDRVKLEGLVTANDNFKILEDGSIEANAGTFSGHIRTNFHLVESSDAVLTSCSGRGEAGYLIGRELSLKVDMAGSSNGADIILPNDVRYIGSRVTLYNGCHPPYTRTVGSIRYSSVRVDDGTLLRGSNVNLSSDSLLSYSDPYRIDWISGIIELVGTPELNGRILADLVSWRGASAGPPASPSSGWLYYDTKRNRNYLYWYGAWVEFPVYGGASDDLRITWKGELSSAPENPERNWLYVTSVNRFLLLYTGEDWEEPAIINSLNKCGWCILGFSALSYHYYND